jgi:hypothetical protein
VFMTVNIVATDYYNTFLCVVGINWPQVWVSMGDSTNIWDIVVYCFRFRPVAVQYNIMAHLPFCI